MRQIHIFDLIIVKYFIETNKPKCMKNWTWTNCEKPVTKTKRKTIEIFRSNASFPLPTEECVFVHVKRVNFNCSCNWEKTYVKNALSFGTCNISFNRYKCNEAWTSASRRIALPFIYLSECHFVLRSWSFHNRKTLFSRLPFTSNETPKRWKQTLSRYYFSFSMMSPSHLFRDKKKMHATDIKHHIDPWLKWHWLLIISICGKKNRKVTSCQAIKKEHQSNYGWCRKKMSFDAIIWFSSIGFFYVFGKIHCQWHFSTIAQTTTNSISSIYPSVVMLQLISIPQRNEELKNTLFSPYAI